MQGKLTQKFFDNAWKGKKNGTGPFSPNYEFVEEARKHNFDLHGVLTIWEANPESGSYKYVADVPFTTLQDTWDPFTTMSWDEIIPLLEDEVEILPPDLS